MMKIIKKISLTTSFLISTFFVTDLFAQKLANEEFAIDSIRIINHNLDLKGYDKSSIVERSKITLENLKGFWQSYKGLLIMGEQYNPMNLSKPLIIEIDSNKIRHDRDEKFEFFTIIEGKVISEKKETLGIINKITDKVLVITLIGDIAVTRYYYELKL